MLLTGVPNPASIKVQLSRWTKSGKLIKLRNNIYLLSENFRKVDIYEPHIASVLKKPSYISLEKAFEYHGLIPEAVYQVASVTSVRSRAFTTPSAFSASRASRPCTLEPESVPKKSKAGAGRLSPRR